MKANKKDLLCSVALAGAKSVFTGTNLGAQRDA